eukprot:2104022-Amphidinium_carterae.1
MEDPGVHRPDASLWNRSCEAVCEDIEAVHVSHHFEPTRERTLEAVCVDMELHGMVHRPDASLWNRSFEAVCVDTEATHGSHSLEPELRERSLEA